MTQLKKSNGDKTKKKTLIVNQLKTQIVMKLSGDSCDSSDSTDSSDSCDSSDSSDKKNAITFFFGLKL